MYYIGIDLGTSAMKMILADEKGNILNTVSNSYKLFIDGVKSEQNPSDWWIAVKQGIKELLKGFDSSKVRAIGSGGQMHGLVMLDKNGNVIRPAILWNDSRTGKETQYLNETIGKKTLIDETGNIAFAGFTAPKIIWVKDNEPQNFEKLSMILLPKDYVTFMMTGNYATDVSDASGMLLFDCKNRQYSKKMLDICSLKEDNLPKTYESYEVVGTLKSDVAKELSLSKDVKVVAGAGDNAAAAIGMGVMSEGDCNISLGTSGTLFIASDKFLCDGFGSLHSFCHANGKYHLMGCMLSAASCNRWFCEEILMSKDFISLQKNIIANGTNNVYFMPYLMGERCPHNDTDVKGAFIGLKLNTTREDMLLAVLEGVAFGIRDCLELAKAAGVSINSSTICGGGAKSPLWRQLIADVLGIDIIVPTKEEGPSFGGAVLAMVGDGALKSIECAKDFATIKCVIKPNVEASALYEKQYQKYKTLYPLLKDFYKRG